MALLEVKNLSISFGGLRAVDDFNISIEQNQLYGLMVQEKQQYLICLQEYIVPQKAVLN